MKYTVYDRRAFSYVEVVMSMLIIAIAIASSLRAFGSYAVGRKTFEERAVAIELANQLMAEINQLPFAEPTGNTTTLGVDTGESALNRSTFDDIDDYNGWDSSAPRDRANAQMTQYSGYRQQVSVAYVTNLSDPPGGTWASNLFKQITVKISKNDKTLATLGTMRSNNNASN